MQTIRYSDISLFAQQTGNALVFNEHSVNQNIVLILMTPIKSCWFMPQLGCMIPVYLFDPVDEVTALKIQREAKSVLIRNRETRVTVENVRVVADPNNQDYYVRIEYLAPELDTSLITFEFRMAA